MAALAFPSGLPLGRPLLSSVQADVEARFLGAVQGNILKGHGREHQRWVFVRFGANPDALVKASVARGTLGVDRWVTSAREQREQRAVYYEAWREERKRRFFPRWFAAPERQAVSPLVDLAERQLFCGLMLTKAGIEKLGVELPSNEAFSLGLKARMRGVVAADELQAEPYAFEGQGSAVDFDAVFLLACNDEGELAAAETRLGTWCGGYGATVLSELTEPGRAWREPSNPYDNGYAPPREPFGFADGISGPRFFHDERPVGSPLRGASCPDAWAWTNLGLDDVFIRYGGHSGGSFAVLLKIEQDVAEFRRYENDLAGTLVAQHGVPPTVAEYLAPALIMGRTRLGYPLAEVAGAIKKGGMAEKDLRGLFPPDQSRSGRPAPPPAWLNEFEFEDCAAFPARSSGCPFHAHLRKMNPRSKGSGGATALSAIQPVRRGTTYDPAGLLEQKENGQLANWPSGGVGLLFFAYMKDPAAQFEILHTHWGPSAQFPAEAKGASASDPVLFPGVQPVTFGQITLPPMPRVAKRLGGVYLYVPSLAWLAAGGQ